MSGRLFDDLVSQLARLADEEIISIKSKKKTRMSHSLSMRQSGVRCQIARGNRPYLHGALVVRTYGCVVLLQERCYKLWTAHEKVVELCEVLMTPARRTLWGLQGNITEDPRSFHLKGLPALQQS